MKSYVTVTAPRDSALLVSLEDLKAELGVTTSDTDDYFSGLLGRLSSQVESYCRRVFAVEGISELFEVRKATDSISLTRWPAVTVTSVVEDGVSLTTDDYRVDLAAGMVLRRSAGEKRCWTCGDVTIGYTAGYATLPGEVAQVVFDLAKGAQAARTRDPALRSENILEGLYSYTLFQPSEMKGGMPPDLAQKLDSYVDEFII